MAIIYREQAHAYMEAKRAFDDAVSDKNRIGPINYNKYYSAMKASGIALPADEYDLLETVAKYGPSINNKKPWWKFWERKATQ